MSAPTSSRFSVAVHVLTYLASHPERAFSSGALARSTQVSAVHVRKLLGPLREAGVITSRPGVGGGWNLARAAGTITLADVWAVLNDGGPVLGRHAPNHECPVGREIDAELTAIDHALAEAITGRLRRTTVADLVTPAMVAADPDPAHR